MDTGLGIKQPAMNVTHNCLNPECSGSRERGKNQEQGWQSHAGPFPISTAVTNVWGLQGAPEISVFLPQVLNTTCNLLQDPPPTQPHAHTHPATYTCTRACTHAQEPTHRGTVIFSQLFSSLSFLSHWVLHHPLLISWKLRNGHVD